MELIEKLMKLNILYIREMARNKYIKLQNMGQLTEPIGSHSPGITVLKAANCLKIKIERNSKIQYIKEEMEQLYTEIEKSDIKDCKFINNCITDKEKQLDDIATKRLFFMDTSFVGLKDAEEILGISESALKQACQQERLLNTKKLSRNWMVHIPECRAYWNIPDMNEKNLYKNWEY